MAKDFKGHLEPDDPRNPVWGAGGCTWPSIPPYRLRLGSQNAPEEWEILDRLGVLFEADFTNPHDDLIYRSLPPLPPFLDDAWIWRHYERPDQTLRWTLFFNNPAIPADWEITDLQMSPQVCNRNVAIADYEWIYPFPSPGTPLVLAQVYFDEIFPPNGWPPWT